MSELVCCDEKQKRIQDARGVLGCLDKAEELLNSPDRDGVEDPCINNSRLRRAAQWIVEFGSEGAKEHAQANLRAAMELCDACGQFRGSQIFPKYVLCAVCSLTDGEKVMTGMYHKAQRPAHELAVR
jgi:hypothetical protein